MILHKKTLTKVLIFLLLLAPLTAHAAGTTLVSPLGSAGSSIDAIAKNLITYVLGMSGVIALLTFIYGGIFWMLSAGDANKVKKGKEIMIWTVFGLVVIFCSYAFLTAVFKALGVTS
ncbi:MAG: TrbC/VirB2 family protein [Patescibacteria group bacterium]